MVARDEASPRLIRRTRLARALTLALSLGVTATVAALPNENADAWAQESWHATDAQVEDFAIAATRVVTNCNDAGPGSLRQHMTQAADGDVIDLGQLSCADIELTSGQITTAVNNLVIKGWLDSTEPDAPQRPRIRRAASAPPARIFFHTGAGQLTLTDLRLSSGSVSVPAFGAMGGCVRSAGSVRLMRSAVVNCSAESIGSTHPARGGGIFASMKVNLDGKSVVAGNKAKGNLAGAQGGGIYSGQTTKLENGSVVENNRADGGPNADAAGGGIYAAEGLTMMESVVRGNSASGAVVAGGGILVPEGNVLLLQSVVSGNTIVGSDARGGGVNLGGDNNQIKYSTFADNTNNHIGGGIFTKKSLDLRGSSVTGNRGSVNGGGIYAGGSINIENSTIAGNTSTRVSGADLGDEFTQIITIKQSTVSGNKSHNSQLGAGLFLRQNSIIRNSTITGNVERNTQEVRHGAGITMSANKQLELSSTIVAGNYIDVGGTLIGSDIGFSQSETGTLSIAGSHNLLGNVNPHIQFPGDTMLLPDPLLGPLQDNGGLTKTHMPLLYSSTIDNGKANGLANDQRDSGYARVLGIAADIGAVEYDDDRIFYNGFQ